MTPVEEGLFLTIWGTFSAPVGASGCFGRADWVEGSPAPVKTLFAGPPSGFVVEPGIDPECPGWLPACSNH